LIQLYFVSEKISTLEESFSREKTKKSMNFLKIFLDAKTSA